jgi:hypothetical protein
MINNGLRVRSFPDARHASTTIIVLKSCRIRWGAWIRGSHRAGPALRAAGAKSSTLGLPEHEAREMGIER